MNSCLLVVLSRLLSLVEALPGTGVFLLSGQLQRFACSESREHHVGLLSYAKPSGPAQPYAAKPQAIKLRGYSLLSLCFGSGLGELWEVLRNLQVSEITERRW